MNNLPDVIAQTLENSFQYWTTASARIQAIVIVFSMLLAWALTKRSKPRILKFTQESTRPAWIEQSIRILSLLLLPLFLLIFALLSRGLLERFDFASVDLLNPFVNATTAWLIYRLVAGLTHNRLWIRWAAVLAFGMAALQSFGLLKPSFEFLESASFAIGKKYLVHT